MSGRPWNPEDVGGLVFLVGTFVLIGTLLAAMVLSDWRERAIRADKFKACLAEEYTPAECMEVAQ